MKGHKPKHLPYGLEKKELPDIVDKIDPQIQGHAYMITVADGMVYDGDTLRNVPFHVWPEITIKGNLRLSRIQAPEIRTRNLKEKEAGYAARLHLIEMIMGKEVYVQILGKGKYGRLIVELWFERDGEMTNVSDTMLADGHAKVYGS